MEIKGKAHCLFEQSGTFKREFIKLGIPAEDYDIQNNFGETDHQIDLFAEIENAYRGGQSVFDSMSYDDIIMAFFPCIEFSCVAQMWYSLNHRDYTKWPYKKRIDYILEKNENRAYMFGLLNKLCGVSLEKGLRMIIENPWSENTYLKTSVFLSSPSLIDADRTTRGDYFKKPTAFWYWNCVPTYGASYQKTSPSMVKDIASCKKAPKKGLCSEERSMISPDYARNFICDFILGKEQDGITIPSLFD